MNIDWMKEWPSWYVVHSSHDQMGIYCSWATILLRACVYYWANSNMQMQPAACGQHSNSAAVAL